MIIDTIANASRYYPLHRRFEKAFELLRTRSIGKKVGTYEIDGRDLYVIIVEDTAQTKRAVRLEVHRKYIDIQYLIRGHEEVGYKASPQCRHCVQRYDPKKDYALFSDIPSAWITVPEGHFTVFFPSDAHAPMYGKGCLRKAVVKVRI